MLVLCRPHRRLCKLMTDVMTCMCNSAMLVAMVMPWPQSACMPMHGPCVKLLCVPLAQHARSSLSTPSQWHSMPVLNQKHATHTWDHFYYYEWVSLLFINEDASKLEVVKMSRC